ncbi:MAG TPA: hypothetical protein VJW75_09235, partial [Candidatus Eisenbacteria bacterium]|nr:hypothetical protein [Candidatus Eisenbacteria bacterium]
MSGLGRFFGVWAVIAAAIPALSGAGPRCAFAVPAEYLPVRHAAYDEIEALAARGLLDSIQIYTRPLARTDIARALSRSLARHPEVASDLHYRRLERELARELTDLESTPERPESGPLVDTGDRDGRFRVQAAGHLRGDYDEKRAA